MILVTFDCGCSIFISFSLNIFNYFKLCVRVCTCAHAHVFVCMCPWMQVLAEALDSLGLQLQAVVNHPMWMLGSESMPLEEQYVVLTAEQLSPTPL